MVTKAENASTTVSRDVRGLLAYLIDLLVIYLALSLVVGPSGGKFFLDYTIVRGVCFSCIPFLDSSYFPFFLLNIVTLVMLMWPVLVMLVSFSLYALAREFLLDKTLGEKLMSIRFESLERDDHQPLVAWLLRASWIVVIIVIPFGFKVILLLLTVIPYLIEIRWLRRFGALFRGY